MAKLIFHLDLDAFFASCEEAVNPKLRNKPIIVSGRNKRSVVSAANYLARKFGVKAAMPVWQARRLCPQATICAGNYKLYEDMSNLFFDYIKKHFTNICEEMSIDECWIDVTNVVKHYNNDPIKLAKKIQQDIYRNLKLSVSIGISWNKFLAKMATDLHKPRGITSILTQSDLEKKIWPLPIEEMFFVGPASAKKLKSININTIGDLAKYDDLKHLEWLLGSYWYDVRENALGNGSDYVDTSKNDPKSLSVSHTLLDSTNDPIEIETTFKYIAEELADKLAYYNMAGSVVTVIYKYDIHHQYTKNETQRKLIYRYEDLYSIATRMFSQVYDSSRLIRLIGIGIGKLQKIEDVKAIDTKLVKKRKSKVDKIAEQVNKKLGIDLVFVAKDKLK